MKYFFVLFVFPFLSASECGKHKTKVIPETENEQQVKDSVPACVRKLIDAESKQSPPNTPIQVDEYVYAGKKVYLITARCCDQYNMLYDENCKEVCAPSGGFTGRGDGKCKDFDSTAKHVKLIWKESSK
jgi:hypothetical protein